MDCPICFETIHTAYKFSCNHSICKKCFQNMSKKGQTMVYDISMVYHASFLEFEINRVQCPLCRVDTLNKTQIAYLNILNECFPGYIK